ncbi:malate dehydrogenase, mitochondrial-like [Pectinophora gossypiella]|uniref:malate dehydrogenase, mitochondrial-like n=1 Tax=Pectinophora gossypiella TaxID=13191 RepID=UPI00214E68B5|nr:malate dehydrogenase, mitochondrial-like [Pectinophora gossypiella]
MLRSVSQRLLGASTPLLTPRQTYKNLVVSDTLKQLECQCEQYTPPRRPSQKVTVVGAGSDVGRIACLFLKQQQVVKILAMYDEIPARKVLGAAHDLAHIDTTAAVQAFQGRAYLKKALYDADVVLICGGCYVMPPMCNTLDRDLFFQNMQFVRTVCLACAHFCPQAIICVQTPPVDCNFTLCKHTLKQYRVYDKRKLLGVNSINAMRANQLYSAIVDTDPTGSVVPVVCGTGRCTRVPVFSATKSYYCIPPKQLPCLVRLVREADEIICRVKSNNEQGHLSIGFSTARCVVSVMSGLIGKPSFVDSALVEQDDPGACYGMKICSCPLKMGKSGIQEYMIPKLNDEEKALLEDSKCDFNDMLNLGRCYAVGDEYQVNPCKFCPCYIPPPCETCKPCRPYKKRDSS